MSEEVIILDINKVNIEDLPSILSDQVDKLKVLDTNVKNAVIKAEKAKKEAENAQVKIGLFESKKNAIELLQGACEGLAEGIMTAAEAQQVSFEYHTKLTEITKFLLGLGVSNLAMNRSVVKELELKLKGASEEEISDLAKQELKNIIMQLKAQEDMMSKQAKLTDKIHQQHKKLLEYEEKFQNQKKKNSELEQKIDKLDAITKKSGWKIAVSVVAIGSLILNILLICGVI